jgi:hypothetical protein
VRPDQYLVITDGSSATYERLQAVASQANPLLTITSTAAHEDEDNLTEFHVFALHQIAVTVAVSSARALLVPLSSVPAMNARGWLTGIRREQPAGRETV